MTDAIISPEGVEVSTPRSSAIRLHPCFLERSTIPAKSSRDLLGLSSLATTNPCA